MMKRSISYWVNLGTVRRIFHQRPVILWGIACASVFVIAVADYFTGSLVTLSAFYLGPLILVAWSRSRTQAQLMILLIIMCWAAANYYSSPEYNSLGVILWNAFVRCDLSPKFKTMTLMRFPINWTQWRSQNEKTLHRRTNHQSHQAA